VREIRKKCPKFAKKRQISLKNGQKTRKNTKNRQKTPKNDHFCLIFAKIARY